MSRTADISFDSVYTYIAIGRQKVLGHRYFDPYSKYQKEQNALTAMRRDAHLIAGWFNANRRKWTDEQVKRAHDMIVDIQHGPAVYWRRLLKEQLDERTFKIAQSWAEREWQCPGSVDTDGNEVAFKTRQAILNVLWDKAGMKKSPEPINYMRDILCLAFYGPTKPGEKWGSQLPQNNFIDL